MELIDMIIRWESGEGELTNKQVIDMFSILIKTGQAWSLQGSYGRMAQQLIKAGYLDHSGNVKMYKREAQFNECDK